VPAALVAPRCWKAQWRPVLRTFSMDGQTVVMHRLVARGISNRLAHRRLTAAYEGRGIRVWTLYSRALVGSKDRRAVRGILQQVPSAALDGLEEPGRTEINEELPWVLCASFDSSPFIMGELGGQ